VSDFDSQFPLRFDVKLVLGRHPCAGMKVAKLEIKMIVALFVVGYDYDVVDSKGRISEKLPVPDYNDIQQVRTSSNPIVLIA
jgi:hypothetical protein